MHIGLFILCNASFVVTIKMRVQSGNSIFILLKVILI